MLHGLNDLGGFGVSTPVWISTETAPALDWLDANAAPQADDPVICAVLEDPSHPHYGEIWKMDILYNEDLQLLQLTPHLPFAQKTTYACFATRELVSAEGDCYEQPDHLQYVLSQTANQQHPDYEVLEPVRQKLAPYFQTLFTQHDLAPEDLISATIFRTEWITHDLEAIRAYLAEYAQTHEPQVSPWEKLALSAPDIDSVWEASFQSVGWMHRGWFDHDENGAPIVGESIEVMMRLVLPVAGAGPDGRAPVVFYGHGVEDDRTQAWEMSKTLAALGMATLSIDFIYHGDRSKSPGWMPVPVADLYKFFQFFNMIEPRRMRDNMRQDVADLLWLKHVVRSLEDLDLAPATSEGDDQPDLDPDTIFYVGMSMGSMHGPLLAAIEPDISTFFLNVGADHMKSIAMDGPIGSIVVGILRIADWFVDYTLVSQAELFFDMAAAIFDAGDGYAYGRYVLDEPLFERTEPINLLHQMAAFDNTLGGVASSDMARSLGTTLLRPYVYEIPDIQIADAPLSAPATFMFDTDDHPYLLNPDSEFFAAAHLQAAEFFRTAYENGVATIINPLE